MSTPNRPASFTSGADQLTIETPEQTALDFAIAGIGSRFLALLMDTLIQSGVGLIAGICLSIVAAAANQAHPGLGVWVAAIVVLFYFLLYFGYFAYFEIFWNGQTPGKRKVGIRVIKDDGRPLTPSESIGRNLLRIVDWLPFMYGVGVLCAFFSKGNKRLGDLVVGSLVVRETSLAELKPIWQTAPNPESRLPAGSGPLGAINLSPQEIALIESYLSRRSTLDYHLRSKMAYEVFQRVKDKVTIPEGTPLSPESLLEAISLERRNTAQYS